MCRIRTLVTGAFYFAYHPKLNRSEMAEEVCIQGALDLVKLKLHWMV